MEIEDRVLKVLEQAAPGIDFTVSETLVDDGILDSITIVSVIAGISMEFNIMIPFDDLESSNFNSVGRITDLVKRYVVQ